MIVVLALAWAALGLILAVNLAYLHGRRLLAVTDQVLPHVSVLIPARNEEGKLPALLGSLFVQAYPKLDVHVYDDGSEDRTWEVLTGWDDARLRPVRGEGPPAGWVGGAFGLERP